MADCKIDLV